MGRLTTHVLDTMNGCPGGGIKVTLQRIEDDAVTTVTTVTLNSDGRNDSGSLLEGAAMVPGRYRLLFAVASYFRGRQIVLPEPAFLDVIPVDFGIADVTTDYHVPLLVSPWAYSTYRGS